MRLLHMSRITLLVDLEVYMTVTTRLVELQVRSANEMTGYGFCNDLIEVLHALY